MRSSYRTNVLRATRTLLPLLMLLSNATTTAALALAQIEDDVPAGDEASTTRDPSTTTMVLMTVMATSAPPQSTITSTATTPHPGSTTTTTTLAAVTSTAAATPSPTAAPKQIISNGLLAAIIVMSVFVIGGLFAMALLSCLQLRRARLREREADVAAQDTRMAARRRRAAAHLVGVGPRVATPVFFASAAAVAAGEKVGEWLDDDEGQRTWPGYQSHSRLGMRVEDKKEDAPGWRESVVEVDEVDLGDMEPEPRSPGPSRGTIRWT